MPFSDMNTKAEKDLSGGKHLETKSPCNRNVDPHPRGLKDDSTLPRPRPAMTSASSATTLHVAQLPSLSAWKSCDSHAGRLGGTGGSALPCRVDPPSEHADDADDDDDDDNHDYPEGGLRAWLVVLGSFCGMVAGFGIMNTVGTLQAYISAHQLADTSPEAVGWIFSVYIFLAFFCGLQIGPIFDAKGPRWLVAAGSVLTVGGTLALAECTQYWHFILAFSVCDGLGTSLLFTPAVASIAHFFSRRRGTATGLAATGGSVGGVIFPLMLESLFAKLGWAWSIRIMALIFLLLVGAANLLVRSRLPPKKGGSVWPDLRIFRHRNFAVTTAGVFFMEWGLFVPLAYCSSWAASEGVGSAAFAFQLLAVLNAASFFGRWLPGYVADRWGRFNTMILAMAICLIFVLGFWLPASLPGLSVRGSVALAVLFAVGFGFGSGSGISLTPVCVGQLCATQEYGRYYATCYTLVSLGCLTGVPIAGTLLTRAGGEYGPLIAFVACSYALGLACFVFVRVSTVGWGLRAVY